MPTEHGDGSAATSEHEERQPEPVEARSGEPSTRSDQMPDRPSQIIPPGNSYRTRLFTAPGVGSGEAGRRSRALTSTGRTVGALPAHRNGRLHLTATIRAAAPRQIDRGRLPDEPLRLATPDLRLVVTEGRESNLVLLVVERRVLGWHRSARRVEL